MSNGNDFFAKMCRDAENELAAGDYGWKEAHPNTLILACFGRLTNHLTHQILRPLWWVAGMISAGVVTWIVMVILDGIKRLTAI